METKRIQVDLSTTKRTKKCTREKNTKQNDGSTEPEKEPEKEPEEKERKKRNVTETKRWIDLISVADFLHENQVKILRSLKDDLLGEKQILLRSQLTEKIRGYRSQDIAKDLLDPTQFIDYDFVVSKLIECELHCFYCKEQMVVFYTHSREPKQWSIERIDNTYGHNKNNVEMACLTCNIRRRCMYHERFRFTKQLQLKKIDPDPDPDPDPACASSNTDSSTQ